MISFLFKTELEGGNSCYVDMETYLVEAFGEEHAKTVEDAMTMLAVASLAGKENTLEFIQTHDILVLTESLDGDSEIYVKLEDIKGDDADVH